MFRSEYLPHSKFVLIWSFATENSSVICCSIGNYEIAKPLRGRRLRAQVCGVSNIHRVEDLLHWKRGNSRRVRVRLTDYPPSYHPSTSAH
jgi:hypothetical protein